MKLKYKCEELARNYKNIGMKELKECYERLSRNPLRMYLSYFKIKHGYETVLSLFEFIKNYENALPLFVYLEKDKLGKEVEGLKSKITEYEHIKNERDKLELVGKELESKITEYERMKKLSEEELRSKITEYEYVKNEKGNFNIARQKNIDFGGGVERTIAVLNGLSDNYLTDCFLPIIEEIEKISRKKYGKDKEATKAMRIIADHIKASAFIIADGVTPSNTEQGYVLRRLIRRAIRYGKELGIKNFTKHIAEPIFKIYEDYAELKENKNKILEELKKEEDKFLETIERGMKIFKNLVADKKSLSGEDAFFLYQSYGFPVELIEEECKKDKIKFLVENFYEQQAKHQELSRTAAAGRFKSGLSDHSEATTKLHTAAHLLLASLRHVLDNKDINQKGSNITSERLRMDFSFPRKLTDNEIKKVEELVNKEIKESIPVKREEMSLDEARKKGALGIFEEKYGEKVSVYTIGNFSKEICTGPHVKNTKDIGRFKIIKEESSSSGVRRIKAVVE